MDADKPPPENAEMFRDMKSKGESSQMFRDEGDDQVAGRNTAGRIQRAPQDEIKMEEGKEKYPQNLNDQSEKLRKP